MANKQPLVYLPDPLLRQKSAPIERIDDDLQRLIDDMFFTMHEKDGIGLAAIQVAVPRRLLVIEMPETPNDDDAGEVGAEHDRAPGEKIVMINPQILSYGSTMREHEEGCLSIPEVRIDIERPGALRVRYMDRDGKTVERDIEGLLATAVQHEIDHLDGRLIIDFLSRLKRDMIIRRFRKMARA
jgi:peptide deformylase